MLPQRSFADVEYAGQKRQTRRAQFLQQMDGLIPWRRLEARLRPVYPTGERGRPPYPLAMMLRIHCVQLFYNLSDPAMEDALYDSLAPGSPAAQAEQRKASIRAKVKHPFLYVKRHFGYAQVRYRGLAKNRTRLCLLLGFANLLLAERAAPV